MATASPSPQPSLLEEDLTCDPKVIPEDIRCAFITGAESDELREMADEWGTSYLSVLTEAIRSGWVAERRDFIRGRTAGSRAA